jgi:hypothetical protein
VLRTIDARPGGSVAVRYRQPIRLGRRERARRIVFATTVAVRYAYGIGSSGTLRVSYRASGPQNVTVDTHERTGATQHLLTLHVGTGMSF